MNNKSMGWKIFGLFVSIFLILGGLSGQLVLRGTNSSEALVVVGFLFLIWDIYSIATHKKQPDEEAVNVDNAGVMPESSEPENAADAFAAALHNKVSIPQEALPDEMPAPQPEYKGIQWYFKVLRHYAVFSGRARRKEYWMFMLFNMIFSFVWSFLVTLVLASTYGVDEINLFTYYYAVAMLLPNIAVAVRRLHDIGKSGWWMLITLIPIVGGIWLIVLMLTDTQPQANQYGPNPKISPEKLSEPAKVKSAGVTLIVASAVILLIYLINIIVHKFYATPLNILMRIVEITAYILLIPAGIFLLKEKQIGHIRGAGKNSMTMMLAFAGLLFMIYFVHLMQSMVNSLPLLYIFSNLMYVIFSALIACFSASVIIMQHNKTLIRKLSLGVIAFAGFNLLWGIVRTMGLMGFSYINDTWFQFSNVLSILLPLACMILAWTYHSVMKPSVHDSDPAEAIIHENIQQHELVQEYAQYYVPIQENIQHHKPAYENMQHHEPVHKNMQHHALVQEYVPEKAYPIETETVPEKVRQTEYGMQMHYYIAYKSLYNKEGEWQRIAAEQADIGRDPGCEIRFDERFTTVSRRHASIVKDGSNWKILPVSQTNPTFVNGMRVHKAWYLQNNDEIQCALNGPKLVFRENVAS